MRTEHKFCNPIKKYVEKNAFHGKFQLRAIVEQSSKENELTNEVVE